MSCLNAIPLKIVEYKQNKAKVNNVPPNVIRLQQTGLCDQPCSQGLTARQSKLPAKEEGKCRCQSAVVMHASLPYTRDRGKRIGG